MVTLTARRHACRRSGRWWAPGLFVLLVAPLVAACGVGEPGRIRVTVEATDGYVWHAEGSAVDGGRLCGDGLHRAIGYEDIVSGEPLMLDDIESRNRRIAAARDPDDAIDYVVMAEWICRDGSGSLVVRIEPRQGGSWQVIGGRGAYAEVGGGGRVGVDRPAVPPSGRNPAIADVMELEGVLTVAE